jgi:hypothetical protein
MTDQAFSSAGHVHPADSAGAVDNGSGQVPGLFGALTRGAEERADGAADSQLTAEWIEYDILAPGVQRRPVRREVFDLVGPSARAARTSTKLAVTDHERLERALALVGETVILPLVSELTPAFVASQTARALLEDRDGLLALMRQRGTTDDSQDPGEQLSRLTPIPGALADLALARNLLSSSRGDIYLASPNVLTYRTGLRTNPSGQIRPYEAFDIVANESAVRLGSRRESFEVRLRQGTFDSNAETFLLAEGGSTTSAAEAFARAKRTEPSWVIVRESADIPALRLPADARTRILDDVNAGYVAVVPASVAGGDDVAWWRIDPATGQTLGIGNRGWGQAAVEYRRLVKDATDTMLFVGCLWKQNPNKLPLDRGIAWLALCVIAGQKGLLVWWAGADFISAMANAIVSMGRR